MNKGCPIRSPNHIDVCGVVKKFLDWNDQSHAYPQFPRIQPTTKKPKNVTHDYDAFYEGLDSNGTTSKPTTQSSDDSEGGGGGSDIFGGTTVVSNFYLNLR